jgi:Uma2 family endonuclease
MTIATDNRPMSLEDYLAYSAAREVRYELVRGVLVDMGAESKLNAQIVMFLVVHLSTLGIPHYLLANKVEIVVSSDDATTRYPDLVLLTAELEALLEDTSRYLVQATMPAPALVVEVVSPGEPGEDNYDRDYVEKRQEYAARGIPEYWIVDPDRQVVLVLTLHGQTYQEQQFIGTDTIVSPALPKLNLTAQQLLSAGKSASVDLG